MKKNVLSMYGYFWVTLVLFLTSVAGHWTFAWYAYVKEQEAHGQLAETKEFIIETSRDTLENWQSEFLQLIWQVAGLAYLFYVGSPQSKEGDDRKEEKIDFLIKTMDKEKGEAEIHRLDKKYHRK